MGDRDGGTREPDHCGSDVALERRVWLWLATGLYVAAGILVWLGSADAPIDTRDSAFWYRTLRDIPGLVDVCGDFTWAARAMPPILAGLGALTAYLHEPRWSCRGPWVRSVSSLLRR